MAKLFKQVTKSMKINYKENIENSKGNKIKIINNDTWKLSNNNTNSHSHSNINTRSQNSINHNHSNRIHNSLLSQQYQTRITIVCSNTLSILSKVYHQDQRFHLSNLSKHLSKFLNRRYFHKDNNSNNSNNLHILMDNNQVNMRLFLGFHIHNLKIQNKKRKLKRDNLCSHLFIHHHNNY